MEASTARNRTEPVGSTVVNARTGRAGRRRVDAGAVTRISEAAAVAAVEAFYGARPSSAASQASHMG